MAEVFRNARNLQGKGIAFSVENGRFVEVVEQLPVGVGHDFLGATVLPGFIDAHCHIMPTGIDLERLNLSQCETPKDILDAVQEWSKTIQKGDWLMAVHYDQTKFNGALHMHRDQIDAVCADIPVVLRHVNGHASVVNTAALNESGINNETRDPKGGEYVRDAHGNLTGVLLERAHEFVTDRAPRPSLTQRIQAVKRASVAMIEYGITCATDMMTGYSDLEQELIAYNSAADIVRLRLVVQWGTLFGNTALNPDRRIELTNDMNPNFCKVIGVKIFADGAIGSATAAVYNNFTTGGNGKLIYDPDRLREMVKTAHDDGWLVAIHSIGDRSTDHVLDAFEHTGEPSRHRLEHAMILNDEQIHRIAQTDCHVAMQPEFLYRFEHAYKKQLQSDIVPSLKRVRSCLDAGIRMSFNSDRPIVSGAPWIGIQSAITRPPGFDLSENIELETALDLYTMGGADANNDTETMGSITEGKFADFQVYKSPPVASDNPKPDSVYVGGKLVWAKKS